LKNAPITSDGFILTDPRKISRIRKRIRSKKRHMKMSLAFLPELIS
jgi:hypothetical protein